MLGYHSGTLDSLPPEAVEAFAGVGNPFSLGQINPGDTILDVGSGGGFDSMVAALAVGESSAQAFDTAGANIRARKPISYEN